MNITDLVGIHETRIAHHVTTIGKVHGEDGTPTVLDRTGTVVMQLFIIVGSDVAPRKIFFDPLQKLHVLGHQILKFSVLGTVFHHPNLAITLDDFSLDFSNMVGDEGLIIFLSVDDFLAGFLDASGAERIGCPRPSQRGLAFLPGLQKRLV